MLSVDFYCPNFRHNQYIQKYKKRHSEKQNIIESDKKHKSLAKFIPFARGNEVRETIYGQEVVIQNHRIKQIISKKLGDVYNFVNQTKK